MQTPAAPRSTTLLTRALLWLLWPVLVEFALRFQSFFWFELPACATEADRLRAVSAFRSRSARRRT